MSQTSQTADMGDFLGARDPVDTVTMADMVDMVYMVYMVYMGGHEKACRNPGAADASRCGRAPPGAPGPRGSGQGPRVWAQGMG